jgi:D-tyrosyl-tRNA(Tyr) deacylase
MRLVVQRVEKAKVIRVEDGVTVGGIGIGLFVLVGIKKGDSKKDVEMLAEKLSKLRVMSDGENKMNLSITDTKGSLLVVSQFTLHADTSGGNRPSFINAEEQEKAKVLYEFFVAYLKNKGIDVATGSFGDYMKIETVLDGPVTIIYSEQ